MEELATITIVLTNGTKAVIVVEDDDAENIAGFIESYMGLDMNFEEPD